MASRPDTSSFGPSPCWSGRLPRRARGRPSLCSSPSAISPTSSVSTDRRTSSSRPYPFRCLNVAPCVWPWSERTTISYGRGANRRARSIRPNCGSSFPQRLERVGPLEARVVSDLVVARERRVHGRAALHHVRQDAVDDQSRTTTHIAPEERVVAAPVPSRTTSRRLARAAARLEDDLPDEQDERACDVVAVGEESAVAGVRRLLRRDPAHREDDLVRLAGEQVAAARPSSERAD